MSTTSRRAPVSLGRSLANVAMAGFALAFAFPFLWMVCGIFKTNEEIWRAPHALLPTRVDLQGLAANLSNLGLGKAMLNSVLVGGLGTIAILGVSSLFAYAVVFLRTRWTEFAFMLVLLTYMLPGAVTYVPSYVLLAKLGLLDTWAGLILSYLANAFSVFFLRQSFKRVSRDFIDAARIDGTRELGILFRVVIPLNASSLSSIGMLTFIGLYNSYLWPSIMINDPDKFLISQALRQFFIQEGAYGMNWGQVMLACTIALLPIVILFLAVREWFLTSIAEDSGVKA